MTAKNWWDHPDRGHRLADAYHFTAEVIGWDRAVEFGMRVWQEKRPPSRSMTDPVHGGGTGCIYVPNALTSHSGRELVRLAGSEDAKRLVAAFRSGSMRIPSDGRLEFPCIVNASIPRRNAAIAQQVRDGWSVATVALTFDLNERTVRRICKFEGVDVKQTMPKARALKKARVEGVRSAVLAAHAIGGDVVQAARKWGFAPDVAHAVLRGDPVLARRRRRRPSAERE